MTVGTNVEAREVCVRMAVVHRATAVGEDMVTVLMRLVMRLQIITVVWEEQVGTLHLQIFLVPSCCQNHFTFFI